MMPVIDSKYAWRVIRDARERNASGPWQVDDRLVVEPGGRWSAQTAVDDDAAQLFDSLLPVAYGPRAIVIAQLGQSLDGRIATASGHSHYVTGEASRMHLHRLRALVDAVIVGAGTVEADDPQLTVRHVEGEHPVRVVLDPRGRVSRDRRLFRDHGPPTWHVVSDERDAAPGAMALRINATGAADLPHRLLAALAARGLHRVLVEGGGVTISRFIDADCIDRLHTVVAPLLIGSGRPALALAEIETLRDARRPACRSYPLGDDRLYDLDLRANAPG
ncbi:RibD family protein [Salinisphaera hydrothermalis]|uniref:RibD family protein n=1 Tax=Salinisphaera hydrothermalis TaxID=563188 RepID=UPI003342A9C1